MPARRPYRGPLCTDKCDVAVTAPTDDQLPMTTLGRATDQSIVRKDIDRLHDLRHPWRRFLDFERSQMVDESIEIIQHFGRQLDARHGAYARRGVRATGFAGRSPRMRASTWLLAWVRLTVSPVASTFARRRSATR